MALEYDIKITDRIYCCTTAFPGAPYHVDELNGFCDYYSNTNGTISECSLCGYKPSKEEKFIIKLMIFNFSSLVCSLF
jgi:hypothetical protein